MRNVLISLLVVAALGLGAYLLRHKTAPAANPAPTAAELPPPAPEPPATAPEPVPAPPLSAAEALGKAEALTKAGRRAEAVPYYEQVLAAEPDGKPAKRAAKALAEHSAELKQDRKALGYWLRAELSSDARAQLDAKAKAVADSLLTSSPSPDDLVVTVAPGDTLGTLAKRHGTTPECIARVNQIKNVNAIVVGQRLKVIRGTFRILVAKRARRLTLLLDGVPVRTYPVGIGVDQKTPTFTFTIEEKVPEPPWHPPGRAPLPFGHPENILGTRWMGFKPTPEYAGYGIHGTTKDDTIGEAASNGCVRMHNADVEELFDLVPRGTFVEIRD